MEPLTASALFIAPEAGAEAGGAAVLANPIAAALAAAAAGTAYGFSPSVRKYVNKGAKSLYEGFTNPFQHFGDGSEKDTFGNLLNGGLDLSSLGSIGQLPGINGEVDKSIPWPTGWNENPDSGTGFTKSLLGKVQETKKNTQQQQQTQPMMGGNSQPLPAMPSPIAGLGNYLVNSTVPKSNGFYPNLLSRRMY